MTTILAISPACIALPSFRDRRRGAENEFLAVFNPCVELLVFTEWSWIAELAQVATEIQPLEQVPSGQTARDLDVVNLFTGSGEHDRYVLRA
jgi:hypothetical protein